MAALSKSETKSIHEAVQILKAVAEGRTVLPESHKHIDRSDVIRIASELSFIARDKGAK